MTHPDLLPTGKPTATPTHRWGSLPVEERLGVGVLGLHEGHTMLVALRTSGLCRAVAGCDLAAEKRRAAREASPGLFVTEDYDELLARQDVHIVAIYTPDALHADQIVAAFEAGKDVICTKPLINDPAQIPRLREAAQRSGRRLQVGQSTRFYEPFLRQRLGFEAGELGEIELVDAHYIHRMDWYYEKSPWTIATTHWAYLGLSHPVDLARWYLGEIRSVQAVGQVSELGRRYGLRAPDIIVANFVGERGGLARVMGHYGAHELPKARALIECWLQGSRGSSLARYPDLRYTVLKEDGVEIEEDYHHALAGYHYRHELKGMHYGEFCNIADSFARAILDGTPNSPDLEEGLRTVEVMHAVVQALETRQTVVLPRSKPD